MDVYDNARRKFFTYPSTEKFIGVGPRALYRKVRKDLGVPFHQGLVEHPSTGHGVIYHAQRIEIRYGKTRISI